MIRFHHTVSVHFIHCFVLLRLWFRLEFWKTLFTWMKSPTDPPPSKPKIVMRFHERVYWSERWETRRSWPKLSFYGDCWLSTNCGASCGFRAANRCDSVALVATTFEEWGWQAPQKVTDSDGKLSIGPPGKVVFPPALVVYTTVFFSFQPPLLAGETDSITLYRLNGHLFKYHIHFQLQWVGLPAAPYYGVTRGAVPYKITRWKTHAYPGGLDSDFDVIDVFVHLHPHFLFSPYLIAFMFSAPFCCFWDFFSLTLSCFLWCVFFVLHV